MKKEEMLKILGFKSCHICHIIFSEGGEMTCIDWGRPGLKQKTYYFCKRHEPTFGCELAIGGFGRYYRDNLKVFVWISGSTETSPHWSQVDKERVQEWLEKIYKD